MIESGVEVQCQSEPRQPGTGLMRGESQMLLGKTVAERISKDLGPSTGM